MTLLLLFGGVSGVWADDTSVTFANGITWERAHGISTFDDTNKVITGTTSNWGAIGYKTVEGTSYTLKKDRLTWLVITGTNLSKGTNNPCVFNINGELGTKIKYVESKSSETKIVIDITKYQPKPDDFGNVTITSLGFYLDDPNGTAGDHEITENQPTITNIEIVYPETDTPIHATKEICYRSDEANTGWKGTWEANSTNTEYEINYYSGFFALQKYTVENLAAVKSLTVHIYGDTNKGHDAMAIWAFNDNEWTTSSDDASTLVGKVAEVVGIAPRATTGTANTPLVNGTNNRYTADGVQHCLFVISGTALEKLKEAATGNTFTLLITNRTGDLMANHQRKYYTSGQTIVPFRPYIEVTDTYPAAVGNVGYETLNAAFDGITTSGTINLYDDITITSLCNTGSKTISVVPAKDDITISSSINNGLWILNNSVSGRLTIGSDEHQLTIDGSTVTNSGNMLEATNSSETTVNNVLFKNCTSTDKSGVVCVKNGAKLYMKGCAFDGCVAPDGRGVVFCGVNDGVVLSGNNTFTNITTDYYDMYLEQRFQIHETEGISNTSPIKIYAQENKIGLGNLVATKATDEDVARFFVMNPTYALFKADGSGRRDLKVCEGKTLEVSSYGAVTFVLPFAATIPEGVECYTLNYTEGNAYVKATPVSTTLSADTPVLVNADQGLYKFRNSEKATTATSYKTSATPRVGALTGVYATTMVPEGSYILYADAAENKPIGFYKSNNSTVAANRAYLTADGAAARSITVVYDDDELTGIKSVESGKVQAEGVYYDLSGRRVALPTKGLYIVNGKKVIIK